MIFIYGGNADASPLRGCWWIKNNGGPRLKTKQTYLHSEGIPALKSFFLLSHHFCKLVAFCISKNCSLLYVHSRISHPCIYLLASVASLSLSSFLNRRTCVALFSLAHVLLYSKNTVWAYHRKTHLETMWKLNVAHNKGMTCFHYTSRIGLYFFLTAKKMLDESWTRLLFQIVEDLNCVHHVPYGLLQQY